VRVRDNPTDAVLPEDEFLPVCTDGKNTSARVQVLASPGPHRGDKCRADTGPRRRGFRRGQLGFCV
jgi:hypothetical protein